MKDIKNLNENNETQLDISANEEGMHVELEISWKRLSLPAKISGFLLSHLVTFWLTAANPPSLPQIPGSTPPQIEIPILCDRKSDI
ncbi:hypothetical protein TUMEXPCC7403_15110 [Tumidithrix helvetica PCC 7403]|uniref:hypothetical protein n=1 Tax=Tumidithrix helvetica TaxID=3457545 RepID=UPI003C959EFA